jgi:hypothetical protein
MPRIGRPPLKKCDRQVVVTFRITPAEKRWLEIAAKARDEKLSAWIRAELMAAADVQMLEATNHPA